MDAILSVIEAKVCPGWITGALCSPTSTSVGLAMKNSAFSWEDTTSVVPQPGSYLSAALALGAQRPTLSG
jgi:hypothetical protein